jgi:hypothetical protein
VIAIWLILYLMHQPLITRRPNEQVGIAAPSLITDILAEIQSDRPKHVDSMFDIGLSPRVKQVRLRT